MDNLDNCRINPFNRNFRIKIGFPIPCATGFVADTDFAGISPVVRIITVVTCYVGIFVLYEDLRNIT